MRRVYTAVSHYSREVQRRAWHAHRDPAAKQQLLKAVEPSREKLDYLAKTILALRKSQQQYLEHLIVQNKLTSGAEKTILEARMDWAETREDTDIRSYVLQQQAIEKAWAPREFINFLVNPQAAGSKEEKKEEAKVKDVYDVELTSVSAAEKIKIIKAIRETMNLGLKEAKELVEKTPVVIKQAKKEEAEALSEILTKAGCVITLK